MKSLIIDSKDETIKYDKEKIITSKHSIPTKLIDILVLNNTSIISSKDIIKITNQNIPILFISNDNKQISLTLPAISKNSELKYAQYKAIDKRIKIAKKLLETKLNNHKISLENFDIKIDIKQELDNIKSADNIDTLLGIEGSFAKKYFNFYFKLFEKKLTKGYRSKRPPLDPVNAILSFLYTLSYNTITAKLYMKGFEPSISYLHTPFRNHFALSSDLLEPIRSDINDFVVRLFKDKILESSDFTNKNGVYLKYNSRKKIWKEIKPFMEELNKRINKEIAVLKKEVIDLI